MSSVGETFNAHPPGVSKGKIASVGLSAFVIMRSDVNVLAVVLDDSCVVGGACAESSLACFAQHIY